MLDARLVLEEGLGQELCLGTSGSCSVWASQGTVGLVGTCQCEGAVAEGPGCGPASALCTLG